jgi:hypothetical protein
MLAYLEFVCVISSGDLFRDVRRRSGCAVTEANWTRSSGLGRRKMCSLEDAESPFTSLVVSCLQLSSCSVM